MPVCLAPLPDVSSPIGLDVASQNGFVALDGAVDAETVAEIHALRSGLARANTLNLVREINELMVERDQQRWLH
jgi:hypothetical protein